MIKVNSDRMWSSNKIPRDTFLSVDATEDPYSNGVRLDIGDAFHMTLEPQDALQLAERLTSIASYLVVFQARFGMIEREAKITRKE